MQTAIVTTHETGAVTSFDTSILAGTKSPNTIAQYEMHFRSYLVFAGSFAAAVEPATLARWRQALFQDGYAIADGGRRPYSVNAINQRLAAVRSLMAEAAQQGYITHETAEAFKYVKSLSQVANKDRRKAHARTAITKTQMQAICDAPDRATLAGKMHHALLLTLGAGGMRITEAVTLQYGQIAWGEDDEGRQGWMVYIAGKNKVEPTPRPFSAKAKAAIDAWLQARSAAGIDAPYIFTSFGGRGDRAPSDRPMNRVSAWEMVQRYARRVGLEHVKPHDFRRYVGTQLAKKDIRLAQVQLGHADISTTAKAYVLDGPRLGVTDDLL
jgi:integrase